jgi:hypothetical protein
MNIESIFSDIVKTINPSTRFIFGNWIEISNNLALLELDKSNDGLKYPIIVMHNDFDEVDEDKVTCTNIEPTFYIITEAINDETSAVRLSTTYANVIYPLWDKFKFALFDSNLLVWDNENNLETEKYLPCTRKNLYYLTNETKEQNKLNDIVDAMSIKLTIKIRK